MFVVRIILFIMFKKIKGDIKMKLRGFIGLATAGVMLLSGCGNLENHKTAMTIGDTKISAGVIKFVGEQGSNYTDPEDIADIVEQNYMINAIADKMDLTMDDDEKEKVTTNVRNFRQQLGGKKETDKILKEYGINDDVLEVLMSTSIYAPKIMEILTIEEPTDEEIRDSFKNDYLRAKHILISTKDQTTGEDLDEAKMAEAEEKANEILERAKNGEDFDALIAEYNEDPGMSSNPDGYFFTDGDMVQEFEDATKSIQPNEITICKSSYGYHIIKRLTLEESDEKFEEYFESAKSSVEYKLNINRQQEAFENKAEELGIEISRNDDIIKGIVIEEK